MGGGLAEPHGGEQPNIPVAGQCAGVAGQVEEGGGFHLNAVGRFAFQAEVAPGFRLVGGEGAGFLVAAEQFVGGRFLVCGGEGGEARAGDVDVGGDTVGGGGGVGGVLVRLCAAGEGEGAGAHAAEEAERGLSETHSFTVVTPPHILRYLVR